MRAKSDKRSVNSSSGSASDFAAPSKSAPTPSSSSRSGGLWGRFGLSVVSVFMWLLNAVLLVAAYVALSNWTAINWMTGSYGWAALLEIGALLLLLFLCLAGCCLFGFSSRVDASFVHLSDAPQMRTLFARAMPFLIVCFFGCMGVLALLNLRATNLFLAAHAEAVYSAAAGFSTNPAGVDVHAFIMHVCSLQTFRIRCTWVEYSGQPPNERMTMKGGIDLSKPEYAFYSELSDIFDSMVAANSQDNLLTAADIYRGVHTALQPYKRRLGWSALIIAGVALVQFGYYAWRWYQYDKTNKKESDPEKERFIGP